MEAHAATLVAGIPPAEAIPGSRMVDADTRQAAATLAEVMKTTTQNIVAMTIVTAIMTGAEVGAAPVLASAFIARLHTDITRHLTATMRLRMAITRHRTRKHVTATTIAGDTGARCQAVTQILTATNRERSRDFRALARQSLWSSERQQDLVPYRRRGAQFPC